MGITGIIFIRHCSLLKTFLIHPSLLLLPAFTCFSFESNTKCCKCNNRDSQNEVEITFSVKATSLNILFSFATLIVATFTGGPCPPSVISFVTLLVAILLTVILLLTTCCSPCSCSCSSPNFISSSCCPPLEFGIYLPDSPHKVFVKDQTQPNRRKEIKEEEDDEAEEVNLDEEGKGNERARERNEEKEV